MEMEKISKHRYPVLSEIVVATILLDIEKALSQDDP